MGPGGSLDQGSGVDSSIDGSDGIETPLGRRGRRTRAALVDAARTVFERDGFVNARIADISAEADYAHGTFYTYFQSKEEIFKEVVLRIQDDMVAVEGAAPVSADPYTRIETANRNYVSAYKANAKLMATLEQAVTINPEIRQLRLDVRERFTRRNTRAISRWQAEGIADPTIDASYAAHFLGAMVDRSIYTWLVLGEPFEEERVITTLTRLWTNALGIVPPGAAGAKPTQRREK